MGKKTYQGVTNDKERSKTKLIVAVGAVIRSYGYTGLNASKIAKNAGLDRKLINLYFGNVDNLIEQYVKSKDYWVSAASNAGQFMEALTSDNPKEIMKVLLTSQFDFFYNEEEMQKLIIWQISERNKIMSLVAEDREKLGTAFFKIADPYFEGTDVDVRAISALLVAGIYYLVLHAKSTDSLFCEIDINTNEGIIRIKNAIEAIVESAFSQAYKSKN